MAHDIFISYSVEDKAPSGCRMFDAGGSQLAANEANSIVGLDSK